MNLYLPTVFFFLVIPFPSGDCVFGNSGVEFRSCLAVEGKCFFGCKIGWTWVAFCHNMLSCCVKAKKFLPPQSI
uniref:Defensin beta 136 n=1 Tax=Marmota marmota marmota TaxID=9994 RepID=A0A8C6ETH3_MARMA